MRNESAARRWLPIFATAVLLGITCWQLVDSSLPPRIWLVEAEVVVVASVMLEITIRLRRAARVNASVVALVHGLTSVGLCTLVLGLSAPRLTHPVPLIVLGFVAVLLTVDPSARAPALWTILLASCAGLAAVWWWGGTDPHVRDQPADPDRSTPGGCGHPCLFQLVADRPPLPGADAKVASRCRRGTPARVDHRTRARSRPAVLGGCHETYPDATWGRVLLFEAGAGGLATLPLILGPSGVTPASGPMVIMAPGDGVIGRVYLTGEACLLRTPRDIKQAYAAMPDSRLEELEKSRWWPALEKRRRGPAACRRRPCDRRARAHLPCAPRCLGHRRSDRRAGDRRRGRGGRRTCRPLRGEGAARDHRPADQGRQPARVRGASRGADRRDRGHRHRRRPPQADQRRVRTRGRRHAAHRGGAHPARAASRRRSAAPHRRR